MSGYLSIRVALFLYAAATAGFLVFVIRQNKNAARVANWVLAAGFLSQGVALALETARIGQLPVLNMAGGLGFLGWILAGGYLVLYWRYRLPVLGALTAPSAAGLALVSMAAGVAPEAVGPLYRSVWLTLHLGLVFGGYGFFGLAFATGIMYLVQEDRIKRKRLGAVTRRLPSLNVLDRVNHYCLTIGFPLMTVGILTGAALAQMTFGTYWRWDPKEVWTLVTWLIYAALLHQRLTVGWRGRRAALMAILGFAILCFTFFGVNLLTTSYHGVEGLERLRVK